MRSSARSPVAFAALLIAANAIATAPGAAAVGAWGEGAKASARLVAVGIGADGKLIAGIEIVMPPGWHTYWRSPGDAGIAPIIDFSASKNLGTVDVAFPVPTRLDDGFAVTNIYTDRVVLPVSALVIDPAKPIDLAVKLEIGVCEEICVPDALEARLTVPAGERDAEAERMLTEALALVPSLPEPGVFAIAGIARDGGTDKRPVFRIVAMVPNAGGAELFVEGPPDWSAYVPEFASEIDGKAAYTVKFGRLGAKTPIEGASLRVTIVSGGRAIEQTMPLD